MRFFLGSANDLPSGDAQKKKRSTRCVLSVSQDNNWVTIARLEKNTCAEAHTIVSAVFTMRGKLTSLFYAGGLCLWILTIHHQGMQGSVNVCRLPFYLNNPF